MNLSLTLSLSLVFLQVWQNRINKGHPGQDDKQMQRCVRPVFLGVFSLTFQAFLSCLSCLPGKTLLVCVTNELGRAAAAEDLLRRFIS